MSNGYEENEKNDYIKKKYNNKSDIKTEEKVPSEVITLKHLGTFTSDGRFDI